MTTFQKKPDQASLDPVVLRGLLNDKHLAMALGGVLAFADHAGPGWDAAYILALVLHFAGLGHWARGFIGRLQQTPTTFGSSLWAGLAHMQSRNVIGGEGVRLGFVQSNGIGGDLIKIWKWCR